MPNIKSKIKRVGTSAKENAQNNTKKAKVKTAVKKFNLAIENKDLATAEKLLPATVALINSAKSSGVYHKNTASRKIANLNKLLDALKAEQNA